MGSFDDVGDVVPDSGGFCPVYRSRLTASPFCSPLLIDECGDDLRDPGAITARGTDLLGKCLDLCTVVLEKRMYSVVLRLAGR
jgi:hypothetical protein